MRTPLLAVVGVCVICAGVAVGQTTAPAVAVGLPPWRHHELMRIELGCAVALHWSDVEGAVKTMLSEAVEQSGGAAKLGRDSLVIAATGAPILQGMAPEAGYEMSVFSRGVSVSQDDMAPVLGVLTTRLENMAQAGGNMPLEQRKAKIAELQKQIAQAQDQMTMLRTLSHNAQAVWSKASADTLQDAVRQAEQLRMELAGKEARAEALRQQMKRAEEELQKQMSNDQILKQLQEITKLRDRQAAAAMSSAVEVAEAHAKVAEREEALRQLAGGGVLGRLSGELASTMVDVAELRAKYNYVSDIVGQLEPATLTPEQLEKLVQQYQRHENAAKLPPLYHQIEQRRNQLLIDELAAALTSVKITMAPSTQP